MQGGVYRITDGHSVTLDAARLFATVAVFLGHASEPGVFADADVALMGRATIPLFFMLSGYLTAATLARGGAFFTKCLKRYLSLYWVVAPAFFLTLALDFWLISVNSAILESYKFDSEFSFDRVLRETFDALTYSGEYWRLTTVSQGVWSNVAFWFLDYLMAYFVVTAAFYLLRGWTRVLAMLAAILIAGPTVLLLSPLWWAGVLAYEAHRACAVAAMEQTLRGAEPPAWIRVMRRWSPAIALAGLGSLLLIEYFELGEALYRQSKDWASYELRQHLGMAKRYLWQWALVPGLFAALVGSKYLATFQPSETLKKRVRVAAIYTLPIYILHFTFLYVVRAFIPDYQPRWSAADPYLVSLGAFALTVGVAWVFYRFIKPTADRLISRVL